MGPRASSASRSRTRRYRGEDIHAAGANGTLSVEVSCPAAAISCQGTITLKTLNAVSAATRLTVAVGSFKVSGGHMARIKLRLSPKARRLLAHTVFTRTGNHLRSRPRRSHTHRAGHPHDPRRQHQTHEAQLNE